MNRGCCVKKVDRRVRHYVKLHEILMNFTDALKDLNVDPFTVVGTANVVTYEFCCFDQNKSAGHDSPS